MRTTLLFVMALFSLGATGLPSAAAETKKPNVVVLLADDLGWGDLGINKGSIPTPRIDRLFEQGVRMDNFMGWCVCSPTRAMLLTGRHPFRVGTGPETGGELEKAETTIADAFKQHGYATGIFGKWHNGGDPDTPEYRKAFAAAWKDMPNKTLEGGLGVNAHGFDEAWIYYGGGADFFTRRTVKNRGPVSWWHNREFRTDDVGYTEDFITQHAIEFIRANRERPFFCYVPFHIVHAPLQAKDSDLKAVDPHITDETRRVYTAMVKAMDANVAAILGELETLGLSDNTIVVFSSDNGATPNGSNLPLRGGKHSVYEGGVRLPTAIYWPQGGLTGGRTWPGLAGFLDLFPTLMDMAGLPMPETRPLDGKTIWPALRDDEASPIESYYWVWRDCDAIRTADWKLLRYFDHDELYAIREDHGEAHNVAEENPKAVAELHSKMDAWATSLGAALTHRAPPATLDTAAAPEGEVLEVTVTVTDQARPKDRIVVPFAGFEGHVFATDYLEYDLAVGPDSLQQGFYYSPFKGNDANALQLSFTAGKGIDQFGRPQASGPAPQGGPGMWEHRVVGLCSFGPGILPRHGIVFTGGKPGAFKIYLDNVRIRHLDGSTTPLWTNGKDTRAGKFTPSNLFTDLKVRTISVDELASDNVQTEGSKPNFVVILADDLGYGDLGCFGATDIRTPNIDSLARDGMKFTSFYVHQRCSPSRLAFMTGCYAHRVGTTKVIYRRDRMGIHPDEITTPELLKKAGYTCGLVGKWHLGDWEPFHPLNHGFDYFKGAWHVGPDDGGTGEEGGAFTENRTVLSEIYKKCGETEHEEVNGALRFMEENRSRPFMLYYASRGTHSRWNPSPGFIAKSPRPNRYGDAVQELDFEVGRILQKLDALSLSRTTLVVFGSDNGAPLNSPGPSNAPLRDGKWTNFEGGIRTPWLMRWPGRIPAGTTSDAIAGIWDLLPTFCAIAEVAPPTDRTLDGVNLLPVLLGERGAASPHPNVIMAGSTIRQGDWKLFLNAEKPGGKGNQGGKATPGGSLYNVASDPGETTDVSTAHPEVVERLRIAAAAFEKELAAQSRPIGKLEDHDKGKAEPEAKARKNNRKKNKK